MFCIFQITIRNSFFCCLSHPWHYYTCFKAEKRISEHFSNTPRTVSQLSFGIQDALLQCLNAFLCGVNEDPRLWSARLSCCLLRLLLQPHKAATLSLFNYRSLPVHSELTSIMASPLLASKSFSTPHGSPPSILILTINNPAIKHSSSIPLSMAPFSCK